MPVKAYALGEWSPDLAPTPKYLSVAKNARAIANGYAPVKGFSAITPTLGAAFAGGGSFVGSDGTSSLLSAVNGATLSVPVLGAPSTATTGGTLAAATYFYKVTALNANGETIGSNEVSQATTGTTSTVTLTWGAISGASSYRVYRGTAAGAQSVYYAPGNVTTFTDTGAASTEGTVPTVNSASTAKLRKYSGSAWSDVIAVNTTSRWRFTQFGDNVIYANGGALGSYGLITGTAAAIAGAPSAYDVATIRDFVMVLGPNGDQNKARWCDFNNSAQWTLGTGQADEQPLLDGGKGVAIFGGEYGIILQRNAIRRVTYTGETNIWFQFDVISPEIGCIAQGSAAQVGQMIFFLSERGFEMCDGQSVAPIGDEKFNNWFFGLYSRAEIESGIWSAVDPRRSEVMWGMPGTPGRILVYNWVLNKATYLELSFSGLFSGRTANIGLEALDAIYGNLDAMTISLDDPTLQGGNPLLLVVNDGNIVGALGGDNLASSFKIPNVEPSPGKRTRVRSLRPITDATSASAIIDARLQAGGAEGLESAATMRANGKMPIRANGRFLNTTVTIPAGHAWTYIQGVEVECEPSAGR